MRKADLPFVCPDCNKPFDSEGARAMHRRAKHKVKVHSFGDLAENLKARGIPEMGAKQHARGNLIKKILLWPFKALLPKGNKSPNSPEKSSKPAKRP